ncbi:MAG: tyrosine--tRNA ligase [Chitinophagales bacterium]|nr:tyrosine--tRNA ligase [Sphingobacteriales bacterium]
MSTNFIEELKWRGKFQDCVAETEAQMQKESTTGYIGFDPTASSLHLGNFQQIVLLKRLQLAGHKPIALMGGATGRVGDPKMSGERTLLSIDEIDSYIASQKKQLEKFIEFGTGKNDAIMVNNYDWFKDFSFLDFIRDVGKHITVSYMMSKDSVQNRLESGISFTEFTYQLIQGYDFLHLYKNYNCKLQLGGSDQWGNITTGVELVRRIMGEKVYAITSSLVTKSDGTKMGKSESGENVWLDPSLTSPYKLYQYILNRTDDEILNLNRRFSFKGKEEIEAMETEFKAAPHLRSLQKALGQELTTMIHSAAEYEQAISLSGLLFSGGLEELKAASYEGLKDVFGGLNQFQISRDKLSQGIDITEFLVTETNIFPSNGQARQKLGENAISINKLKIGSDYKVTADDVLHERMILVQQGKKNYFFVELV